jgi:hypothetical protein
MRKQSRVDHQIGCDSDDYFVAEAIAPREATGSRKRSCGRRQPDN